MTPQGTEKGAFIRPINIHPNLGCNSNVNPSGQSFNTTSAAWYSNIASYTANNSAPNGAWGEGVYVELSLNVPYQTNDATTALKAVNALTDSSGALMGVLQSTGNFFFLNTYLSKSLSSRTSSQAIVIVGDNPNPNPNPNSNRMS